MARTALHFLLPALTGALLAGPALAQVLPAAPPAAPPAAASELAAPATPHPAIPQPLYLVGSRIILNPNALGSINPNDLAAITVYKGEEMPARWRPFAEIGVVDLRLKPGVRVASRPLRRLKRQLHVRGPVRYLLDGRLLADATLRVATDAVDKLEALPPAPGTAITTIAIGLKPYHPQPSHDPPGTIRIRGVAGR